MKEIEFHSKNELIIFKDTLDHFENAVLRLLSLDQKQFQNWIDEASNHYHSTENLEESLKLGFRQIKGISEQDIIWKEKNHFVIPSIVENPNFGVEGNFYFAWLVNGDGNEERNVPIYEENYFEGKDGIFGGYGNYKEQMGWRLEKAARQVDELLEICDLSTDAKTLDIGSGYGYFRKALDKRGISNHNGLEISKHANRICKEEFGFDTAEKTIEHSSLQNLDLITAWDVVEHVSDQASFFREVKKRLKPGGVFVLKTPNIDCPEMTIFGPAYHSFKREHLVYYSPNSLKDRMEAHGFQILKMKTKSHLLSGFVGNEKIKEWEQNLKGSDIICYLQNSNDQ